MTRHASLFSFALLLACSPGSIRSETTDDVADEETGPEPDLPPPLDLPCGGADLMTDNDNCGTCGHKCYPQGPFLQDPDEWWSGGGGCNDGECGGPVWSECKWPENGSTCRELLEPNAVCSSECNAKTPGTTVLLFDSYNPFGMACFAWSVPQEELALGCDDPIPYPPDGTAMCCGLPVGDP